jgi:tRNA pseudouridine38-40 synthase
MMSQQIVLIIAYDGTEYFGWQTTKEGPSVEETLQSVIEKILQEKVSLRAASRTDRGVHAEQQVVDFFTSRPPKDLSKFRTSLNQLLPSTIVCRKVFFPGETDFHPSTSALDKTYRYFITTGPIQLPSLRHTHWHVHFPLEMDLLMQCRDLLIGTKDFRALANHNSEYERGSTIRTIFEISVHNERPTECLEICITGDAFLYRMARNIVGTLVFCARKKITIADVQHALASGNRTLAGMTAPAHGLSLLRVSYPMRELSKRATHSARGGAE